MADLLLLAPSSCARNVVSRILSPRASSAQMRSRVLITSRPMAMTPLFSIAARIHGEGFHVAETLSLQQR
jgi:hypothetical protein